MPLSPSSAPKGPTDRPKAGVNLSGEHHTGGQRLHVSSTPAFARDFWVSHTSKGIPRYELLPVVSNCSRPSFRAAYLTRCSRQHGPCRCQLQGVDREIRENAEHPPSRIGSTMQVATGMANIGVDLARLTMQDTCLIFLCLSCVFSVLHSSIYM